MVALAFTGAATATVIVFVTNIEGLKRKDAVHKPDRKGESDPGSPFFFSNHLRETKRLITCISVTVKALAVSTLFTGSVRVYPL